MKEFLLNNVNELIFIVCGVVGGIMHYMKKVSAGETAVTLVEWFGKSNWSASIYTLVVFTFMMVGAIAAGVVNDQTDVWAAMYAGFTTGFAVDAGFNGDMKKQNEQLVAQKSDMKDLFADQKKG